MYYLCEEKTHSSNMMVKLILHKLVQSCTNWLKHLLIIMPGLINIYIYIYIVYHQRQCHNKDNNKKEINKIESSQQGAEIKR